MQVSQLNLGMFRITMGRETKPQDYVEKRKILNHLDEAFNIICTHIFWDLLFHLEGLRTPKEYWDKLEYLFGKQYELRWHILENELISLHPKSFESIQKLYTKYKSLVLQCKQCGIESKDQQLVLSILRNIHSEFSVFVSTFHSKRVSIPNWKIPSLDAFAESLIQEQDKLIQMGVLQASKNQELLDGDSSNV